MKRLALVLLLLAGPAFAQDIAVPYVCINASGDDTVLNCTATFDARADVPPGTYNIILHGGDESGNAAAPVTVGPVTVLAPDTTPPTIENHLVTRQDRNVWEISWTVRDDQAAHLGTAIAQPVP